MNQSLSDLINDKKTFTLLIIQIISFIWITISSLANPLVVFGIFLLEFILLFTVFYLKKINYFILLWSIQFFVFLLSLIFLDYRNTFGVPQETTPMIVLIILLVFCEALFVVFFTLGEKVIKKLLLVLTLSSAFIVILIVGFVMNEGLSTFEETSVIDFLTSDNFDVFYEGGSKKNMTLVTEYNPYEYSFYLDEEKIIMQPKLEKTASLYINNLGANPDSYHINVLQGAEILNFTDFSIEIPGNDMKEVPIIFYSEDQGDYSVIFECHSQETNDVRQINFEVLINESMGLDISPDIINVAEIAYEARAEIQFELKNDGNSDNQYLLSIEYPQGRFSSYLRGENISWNHSSSSCQVFIPAFGNVSFTMIPNSLSYVGGTYNLTLYCQSLLNNSIATQSNIVFTFLPSKQIISHSSHLSISNDYPSVFNYSVNKKREGVHHFTVDVPDRFRIRLLEDQVLIGESTEPITFDIPSKNLNNLSLEVYYDGEYNFSTQQINIIFQEPDSDPGVYGIAGFIVGTFITVLISVLIAIPLGVGCAIFLAEYCPSNIRRVLRPLFELLAGIPSILFGLWGAYTFGPILSNLSSFIGSSLGSIIPFFAYSELGGRDMFTASIVLSFMILPIIITLSEDSIRSIPRGLKEGSLAMGATRWETIRKILLPSAKSGVLSSVILSTGRAIGETMAVLMIMSFSTGFPTSLFASAGTMTTVIAKLMPFVAHLPKSKAAMFAIALALIIFIFTLNVLLSFVKSDGGSKRKKIGVFAKLSSRMVLLASTGSKKFKIVDDRLKKNTGKKEKQKTFEIISEKKSEIKQDLISQQENINKDFEYLKQSRFSLSLEQNNQIILIIGVLFIGFLLSVLFQDFSILAIVISSLALIYAVISRLEKKTNKQQRVSFQKNKISDAPKPRRWTAHMNPKDHSKKSRISFFENFGFSMGVFNGPSWSEAGKSIRRERIIVSSLILGALFVTFILFYIIADVIVNGVIGFDFSYFFEVEVGSGGEGGFLNAITGSLELVFIAIGIAFPLALGSAIYIQEYAKKDNVFTKIIMFTSDTLAGTPSIVFGAFGFIFFVRYIGFGVSLLAGGLTLACMALPILLRSCIEAIKAIPFEFQEGSLALGASKWQTIVKAVIPPAMVMISSGVIIGMGRVIGETAAVMFSAGYLSQVSTKLLYPVASLPIMIWRYFQYGPLNEVIANKMYSASLVLIVVVLILNGAARLIGWRFGRMMKN